MFNVIIIFIGFVIGIFLGGIISYDNDKKYLQEIVQLQKDKEIYMFAFEEVYSRLPEDVQREYIKTMDFDKRV